MFNNSSNVDYLVVGLGNPGKKYENTRHNIGFVALDYIAAKSGFSINKSKFQGLYQLTTFKGVKVLFLKPQTFMNLSGDCVSAFSKYYKIPPEKIIVLHDDISLDVGKLRIRTKGSHGGQNGLRDIIAKVNSQDFTRIKIGVGDKPHKDYPLADWVMSSFSGDEKSKLEIPIKNCLCATELLVGGSP